MLYKSKKHYIKAFQITPTAKAPEWFVKEVRAGRVSVTHNDKDLYVTMYGQPGHTERAYRGWWVCMSDSGKLYGLPDEDFAVSYEGAEDD